MSELRPCPRCKEALRLSVQTSHEFYGTDESLYFFVLCSACGRSSYSEYTREEAIKDWNTRPIEDAQVAEIERLKADNARMREALQELYNLNLCPDYKTGASRENLFAEIAKQALKVASDV